MDGRSSTQPASLAASLAAASLVGALLVRSVVGVWFRFVTVVVVGVVGGSQWVVC